MAKSTHKNILKQLLIAFIYLLFYNAKGQVTYDFQDVLTERPSIGENLVWHFFTEEEGHLYNGELSTRFESLLSQSGFENIRFPGGTVSDWFDWKKTLPDINNRPSQMTHIWRTYPNTESGKADTTVQFGVNEALKAAHASGAEIIPVFSPNYNKQHHLDLYEYLTADANEDLDNDGVFWGSVRQSYGINKVKVSVVEYGNELGGNGHHVWYMQPNDGLPRGGGTIDENKALNGGVKAFTNQMAHKGRGSAIISSIANATFASEGLENEEFYAFFPPIQSLVSAKVGTDYNNPSTYEIYNGILLPEGADPSNSSLLNSYGSNDKVFLFRKSDGLLIFGDGIHGKKIPSDAYVFLDYSSGNHTGYLELYNELKAINPNLLISDGAFLDTQSKDAVPIHGGSQFRNAVGLIDNNIVTEMISKGYFSWPQHLSAHMSYASVSDYPSGTEIIVGEHSTLDFGPGASIATTDANGVEHIAREYTILGALQHLLECERVVTQFGQHTDYPVSLFNRTSMTNQAHSIRVDASGSSPFEPDNLFVTSLGIAQEFFIKHTGKHALKSTSNTIPTSTMNFRKLTNVAQMDQGSIPDFIPYASRDEDGEYIYLTAINPSETTTYTPSFTLNNSPSVVFNNPTMEATLIHSDHIYAINSSSERDNIRIDVVPTNDVVINSNTKSITFSIPPLSAKTLKIYAGGTATTLVTPPSGLIKIQNNALGGWLDATNLPDPTSASKNEVRLNSSVTQTPTLWEFVESAESGWYYIISEAGDYLQLTNISDQQGNTSGLALRSTTSNGSGGSWLKWRLIESSSSGNVYIENQEFENYVRATQEVHDGTIPAYFVHGASSSSNGGWSQWKLIDLVKIPSTWTYIDNLANLSETRLRQTNNVDGTGQHIDLNLSVDYNGDWVQWKLIPVSGTSYYHIEGKKQPLRLQIINNIETKDGVSGYATRLVPNTFSGDLTQWEIVDLEDGNSVSLKSVSYGYYLSASNTSFNNNPQSNLLEVFAVPTNTNIKTHWSFGATNTNSSSKTSNLDTKALSKEQTTSTFNLYPNPVTQGEFININLNIEQEETITIEVSSILGNLILKNKVPLVIGKNQLNVDTQTLTQGVYFIKIKGTHTQFNKRVIIK
ncbi:T9SS type A sorting domain-containing protein [Tamlana sp. I1]|uniref:T9SS type A sorting domain-containing protein n=1 Tax=Tamlana sp. I1 TaxID=2762061 RepID=UPI00188F483F|nr:T9SS type A sorting domain-containing protein [Tamlana sp. I1]